MLRCLEIAAAVTVVTLFSGCAPSPTPTPIPSDRATSAGATDTALPCPYLSKVQEEVIDKYSLYLYVTQHDREDMPGGRPKWVGPSTVFLGGYLGSWLGRSPKRTANGITNAYIGSPLDAQRWGPFYLRDNSVTAERGEGFMGCYTVNTKPPAKGEFRWTLVEAPAG